MASHVPKISPVLTVDNSSVVIERCIKRCEQGSPTQATVYFDLGFSDRRVPQPNGLLRSLVSQPLVQCIENHQSHEPLQSFRDHLRKNKTLPASAEVDSLMKVLLELISEFVDVYVIVDALDEVEDPVKMYGILHDLLQNQNTGHRVHVLVTGRSRRIEVSLSRLNSAEIFLNELEIAYDVRHFLEEQLKMNSVFYFSGQQKRSIALQECVVGTSRK